MGGYLNTSGVLNVEVPEAPALAIEEADYLLGRERDTRVMRDRAASRGVAGQGPNERSGQGYEFQ
jgi:hypothetical protein